MANPRLIYFPPQRPPRDLILTDDEHRLLADLVVPYHPGNFAALLNRAVQVPGGRRIDATLDDLCDLLDAVGVEANGFSEVEEEHAGKPLRRPRRGGNAARLLKIYNKIDEHLS
jgi:hypothetical protein